ncbi:hypothetical protein SAMN04487952_1166 [Halomonas caseinilytica]|nr:hypothetical protein SAMN04487952_1166 [Halomonas caseinilytica]
MLWLLLENSVQNYQRRTMAIICLVKPSHRHHDPGMLSTFPTKLMQ